MTDLIAGAQAFQILATRLKEAGETKLRADLNRAIRDAAQPVADEIGNIAHLRACMPDRYADTLKADLQVTTHARAGEGGGITILARAPTTGRGGRKIRQRNEGRITHPVFAQGPRRSWRWDVQTAGMQAGFFSGPADRAAPQVRDKILEAMRATAEQITRRT